MRTCGGFGLDADDVAESQKFLEPAAVGVDRIRSTPEIRQDGQPGSSPSIRCDGRLAVPPNRSHGRALQNCSL
jgi:hypothetical protein